MHQQWADYRVFWRQFRESYRTTGAVLPSGRALAANLSRYVGGTDGELAAGRRILEVGPGTGAVTAQIVHDMRPGDRLTLVERNDEFVACLRQRLATAPTFQRAADRITLLHAAVEELREDEPFDLIISGLPLNNFDVNTVAHILMKLRRLLAPGGTLSFFEYVAIRRAKALVSRKAERDRLRGIGRILNEHLGSNEVRRDLVLTNVPPAWVHHVQFRSTEQGAGSIE